MLRKLTIATVLTLNAALAAAVPIDVYLGPAGQSNGVGKFGPAPGHLSAPQQHFFRFWTESGGIVGADTRPLQPMYVFGGAFGAELSFGQQFSEKIAVIKVAKSGSPMSEWAEGQPMFDRLKSEVAAGLADLVSQGYEPTIKGMMWVQGEYDANFQATADVYDTNLTQLIEDVRAEWGQQVRFVYNQLHADLPQNWPAMQWVDDIREAQRNVAASVPNVRMVNVDNLELDPRDYLHFSPAMQDELGQRFAKAFLSPADLDYNGLVDGADFLEWQRSDGSVETLDAWKAAMTPPPVASIPEPSALAIVAGLVFFPFIKRQTR